MLGLILSGIWKSQVGRAATLLALAVLAIVVAAAAFTLWLASHDADVAQAARQGYVLLAEKTAAEAKAKELQRQVTAGAQALEEHRKRLVAAELVDQQQSTEREQEILEYEARLSQANRRCALSSDDIEFLQRDRAAPAQRSVRAGKGVRPGFPARPAR